MTEEIAEAASQTDPLDRVIQSALRLGVNIDAVEAAQWVAAMTAEQIGANVVVDVGTGAFGHRASMLDFDPADLDHFRRMAPIVGLLSRPGVQTALAISGSAAQSRIQEYPADADFFERIHIIAPTREDACRILGELMHEKALSTMSAPTHRLAEVKLGSWDADVTKNGALVRAGSPMSWTPSEVTTGFMTVLAADGSVRTIAWAEAAQNPGWCKIDWVVADPPRGQLANASNVLDPTWESPDGSIVPLDGFLDPYFQEVYIDADARPLFDRLIRELATDAVDDYVAQLEHEVWKYSVVDPNWGKVARRLYNIFRLSARYVAAAYIRELFDQPATVLYQVSALIRTIDDAAAEGTPFPRELIVEQCDKLIMSAISALTGPSEAVVVRHLLTLRDQVSGQREGDRAKNVIPIRDVTMDAVNDWFYQRLVVLPEIADYLAKLTSEPVA